METELKYRFKEAKIRGADQGHAYRILVLQIKLNFIQIRIPSFQYFCRQISKFDNSKSIKVL